MTTPHTGVAKPGGVSSKIDDAPQLACPRCGLSIRPRVGWLTVDYCPRCIASHRIPVRMSHSAEAPARAPDEPIGLPTRSGLRRWTPRPRPPRTEGA
jgi:hypothetical protein